MLTCGLSHEDHSKNSVSVRNLFLESFLCFHRVRTESEIPLVLEGRALVLYLGETKFKRRNELHVDKKREVNNQTFDCHRRYLGMSEDRRFKNVWIWVLITLLSLIIYYILWHYVFLTVEEVSQQIGK